MCFIYVLFVMACCVVRDCVWVVNSVGDIMSVGLCLLCLLRLLCLRTWSIAKCFVVFCVWLIVVLFLCVYILG